jgi:hypothetical protein
MARWRLAQRDDAVDLFCRSVSWMREHAPYDPELLRFRAEAEALLRPGLLDAAFPSDPFAHGG